MSAIDFKGTIDPTEAKRWLRTTERVFLLMECTLEKKRDYIMSLLQEDAYDW